MTSCMKNNLTCMATAMLLITNHARKPRLLGGEEWHPC
jgi:hypothetical protein